MSNVKVGNAIETHRAKMVKDKNGVMTKVMTIQMPSVAAS